jgi:adenylate kinase
VYHLEHDPPRSAGVCDIDGTRLLPRDDDRAEVVRRRLALYHANTEPLVDYYGQLGVLQRIDGTAAAPAVAREIRAALDAPAMNVRIGA